MKAVLLQFAGLALSGCVTSEAEREVLGCTTLECVGLGESQEIGRYAGDLVITPLEVLEDSRCPVETECVWEGRVRLSARVTMGQETITTELTSEQPLRINGGMLSIGEVAPEASSQRMPLEPEDYRVGFLFAPDQMVVPGPAS